MDIFEAMHLLETLPSWWRHHAEVSKGALTEEAPFQEAQLVAETSALYRRVTAQEGHQMASLALHLFDAGFGPETLKAGFDLLPTQILTNLADVVPGSLTGLYPEFLTRDLSWGTMSLFRQADPHTRDRVIALLETGEGVYDRGALLCALAWMEDENIPLQFDQWRRTPPAWSAGFSYPLEEFTIEAGWELTEDGRRRDLYYQNSYDIMPWDRLAPEQLPGPLTIATMQEETCGWCGRSLMTLFDVALRDPRLVFLKIGGERLRTPLCLNCSFQYDVLQDRVWMDIDGDGLARWSPVNGERPDRIQIRHEYSDGYVPPFPLQRVALGLARPTPYERAGSHIGGCPYWPQSSADYPCCPVCQGRMTFVGQYELNRPNLSYLEGVLYAFVCVPCGKATIGYQA